MTKQILCLHVLNAVQKSVRGYDVLHPRDPEGVLRHAVTLVACMHMYTHTHTHTYTIKKHTLIQLVQNSMSKQVYGLMITVYLGSTNSLNFGRKRINFDNLIQ